MITRILIAISNICLKLAGVDRKHLKNYVLCGTFNTFGNSIKRVELHFASGTVQEHFISLYDMKHFLQACRELYHYPGMNPHSRGETTQVVNIKIFRPRLTGPYWYTTPGLSEKVGMGAKTMEFSLDREIKPEELAPDANNWQFIGESQAAPA